MANGYMGKILWADLSRRTLQDEVLDENMARQFIGGYGLGARILFSRLKAGVDPLGPENILGLVTGPLTGTPALGGSRYVAVGKSPLTGGWGDANSGGYFGPHLKFAGYDAIFVTGKSDMPVYIFIDSGKAELRDASNIWGRDTETTEKILKAAHGKEAEISCIGPSGEKLSRIAAIITNAGRAAGRSGLGAVMGSKKLKAVVARGNLKVPMADGVKASELRKKYLSQLGGHAEAMRTAGTPGMFMFFATSGDAPIKNWAGAQPVDFPYVEKLDANHVIALQENKYACWQCPLGCGGYMKAGTEYKYAAGAHKPEYESLALFGTNLLNDNLESIIMANDICNHYGLDTISTGASIALAIECYENGIITKKDTDGVEMTWGNHQAIVKMTEKIAKREGFGDILADGVKIAAERIGNSADGYAMHIGGQEIPGHDPKFSLHQATAYRLDPTPGRHTTWMGAEPPGGLPLPPGPADPQSQYGRAAQQKMSQSAAYFVQASGLCAFVAMAYPDIRTAIDFMGAVTGWDLTMEELIQTGERIFNMRQAFNSREGINSLAFIMPDRISGKDTQKEGTLKGIVLDEAGMDREYLMELGWDLKTAKPTQKKLLELGLEDVARELWR